ncbi:hypothetical protein Tco_0524569 [Tanacetum coccineum]
MVAFLNKSEGSEDFHQIIDFLNISHIKYVLIENPTIYTSLIHQFWETASTSTSENEKIEITATINGRVKTITGASIRRHLKLEDSDGTLTLPNAEIFEQPALMGYASDSDKLTFQKGHFSPQWRFLIHTILYCLSPKKTVWEQFSSNIATAIICLATNRTFNFSKMIFEGMLKNLDSRNFMDTRGAETQMRTSADTEILLEQEEPTELVEDPGSGENGEKEISTAEVLVTTASAITKVSTGIPERQVYIRRSVEKRKDKGKAIMKDDESVQKKTKKQLEQIDIARQEQEKYDLAQALELQKELDKRKKDVAETTQAHDIDWSDPAVLRYHAQQNRSFSKAKVRKNMCMYLKNRGGYKQSHFKGMSYEDIRPIFERIWDQNQSFVPKDSEIEKEVMKRSGFDFQKPPAKRQKVGEVSGSVEEQSAGNEKEVSEEELKKLLVIVPVEEMYIEALQVYQVFEDMLKRFNKDDLEKLWDLVKKKFSSTEPTIDKEKVLWVELKRLFEPDDDDTLWKLQRYMHDPLKWKLYDTCGVHHVSTERGHDIFMLVEKDYPLTRALMTVMLANKLQVDESSEMANQLLRKIFYQVNHKFRGGLLGIKVFYKVYTASSTKINNDDDDDDIDDEDEEPFEDEGDDQEEEEHLAPADSSVIPIVDPVPSVGDTEAFETDVFAPAPRLPQTKVLFTQTHLCRARKTVRLEPPLSASMEARIAEHVAAPTLPLHVASPPLPLPLPLSTSPTDAGAPLGYRAVGIRMRAASPPLLLPSTSHRTDIPEAEMSPRKRACLTTPAPGLEIGESSAASAARQRGTNLKADLSRDRVMETGYRIIDTWDEIVKAMLDVALTTFEGVNQRVTELASIVRQENKEF